ncbi:LuxR family transcriptional regulator [Arthrobacter echini]|nr:LuxR family transcriptional regulator [Arthrobacter echini]
MSSVDLRWPFSGRRDELTAIEAAFRSDSVGGVMLVGPGGAGKTRVAQQAVSSLSAHFDHVYIRGAAAYSTVAYAALNVLLAELDEATTRSPLLILIALQRMFDENSSGRRILMHVDKVEDVDSDSAAVIVQLARMGAVHLLITCKDLLRAPEAFFDLWKDEVLERIDLRPLTLDATTEMVSAALEAPVSRAAAQELWTSSGGNPKFLQMATEAAVDSGRLFPQHGVWVMSHGPHEHVVWATEDRQIPELVTMSPDDRTVIEVLAVAGSLPVTLLMQAVQSTSLDSLQSRGMLMPDGVDEPLLRLSCGVLADVVRGQYTSAAGVDALEVLGRLRSAPGVPMEATLALAAWSLSRGEVPDSSELAGLAQCANDRGLDVMAARFLDALPTGQGSLRAGIERARQLWCEGAVADALDTVEHLLVPGLTDDTALRDWVDANVLASRLRRRTPGRREEADALLDAVSAQVQRHRGADEDLRAVLDLARLEAYVFEGEFDSVCARAPGVLAHQANETPGSLRIRTILAFAQSSIGEQEAAIRAAEAVVERLDDVRSKPTDHGMAFGHFLGSLFMAGSWNECLELVSEKSDEVVPGLERSTLELSEGLILAYLGRSGEALVKLKPAIGQLHVRDRYGFLPLAEAAAAYVSALNGDSDDARQYLCAVDVTRLRSPWYLREAVLYFRLLTEAWLGTADVVSIDFLEHARHLNEKGLRGVELFFLCQAVQLGRYESADCLTAAAVANEGRFSRLTEELAKALSSRDPGALKQVALEALELGNANLAGDLAALSIDHLVETDDPMIRVQAEQILRRTAIPARRHQRRKLLSERERAIARKVAQGVPNKEIAQQEHISPRTVEGHVHQIMSKLGLSSRKQLSLIFRRQQ